MTDTHTIDIDPDVGSVLVEIPPDDNPEKAKVTPVETEQKADTAPPARTADEGAADIAAQIRAAEERGRKEAERQVQEWQSKAATAEAETVRFRGTAEQAQYDAVLNAIQAADQEAKLAKAEYAAALGAGEYERASDAQMRMSTAAAELVNLNSGKAAMEAARRAPQPERPREPQRQPAADPFERYVAQFTPKTQEWLRAHPEAVTDQATNAEVIAAHHKALKAGHAPESPEYFSFIEGRLNGQPIMPETPAPLKPKPAQRSIPAAPPSRESNGGGARNPNEVKLTARQVDAANTTILWEHGPNKGKPIGVPEYARRLLAMERDGRLNPPG